MHASRGMKILSMMVCSWLEYGAYLLNFKIESERKNRESLSGDVNDVLKRIKGR